MAVPEIRGVGAITSGTGTVAPAYPAGVEIGDAALIFTESGGAAASGTATPALTIDGWDVLFSENTGNTRLSIFGKILVTATDARTTNDTGDHQMARMVVIKKGTFDPDAPFAVIGSGVQAATTSVSINGGTNPRPESLVFAASAGSLPDASGEAQFGSWANASLGSVTERIDNTVTAGDGGALGVVSGTRAEVGTVNATTSTASTSAPRVNATVVVLRKPTEEETEPVRRFTRAGSDEIAAGAVTMTGDWTHAGLIRLDFNTDWQQFWGEWSGGDLLGIYSKPDKILSAEGPGAGSSLGYFAPRHHWFLIVVDKKAGNEVPRVHMYDYSTGKWRHQNGVSGFVPNLGASTFTQLGGSLEGDLAAVAFWTERLSDAQAEELGAVSYLSEWASIGTPKALWLFNQASVATPVEDRVGSADEEARTGTSVVQVVVPIPYEEEEEPEGETHVIKAVMEMVTTLPAKTQRTRTMKAVQEIKSEWVSKLVRTRVLKPVMTITHEMPAKMIRTRVMQAVQTITNQWVVPMRKTRVIQAVQTMTMSQSATTARTKVIVAALTMNTSLTAKLARTRVIKAALVMTNIIDVKVDVEGNFAPGTYLKIGPGEKDWMLIK